MSIISRLTYYIRLEKHLSETNKEDALLVGFDSLAILKNRIQRTGRNSEGDRFERYTPSYAKYGRKKLGYQDRYVDFTRKGELMRSLKAVITKASRNSVEVQLSADNATDQQKINGSFAKRGNILKLSEAERERARLGYAARRRERINNFR